MSSGIVRYMIYTLRSHAAFAACLFILGFCLFAAGSARADDSARLKTLFGAMLEDQKKAAAGRGETLELEGDTQIENAGSYYAVTLPHARLKTKEGNTLEIGIIAVNASAADKPGTWKMTIALPTPFILKDKGGKTLSSLSLGTQKVTGVWNETIRYFTQLDAQYGGIAFTDAAQGVSANIGSLTLTSNLTETTPGKWSGPLSLKLTKFDVTIPVRQMKISLKSISNNVELLSYDPALLRARQTTLAAAPGMSANPALAFLDLLTKGGEGIQTVYKLEGLEVIAPQPGQTDMGKFGLESGMFSLTLSGFTADKVTASIGLNYRGLDPRPLSTHLQNVIPREAKLAWDLENVPVQKLAATVQNTMSAATGNPAAAQAGMATLVFKLSALLSQAQTRLNVEKNYVMNELYRATLDGNLNADISALFGFSSDFVLDVYGLDRLITALENAADEPTTMYRTTLQSWAANLKYFRGFGLMQKDENAAPFHRYHCQLTPQGQIVLNDKDASGLIGGSLLPTLPADAGTPQTSKRPPAPASTSVPAQ